MTRRASFKQLAADFLRAVPDLAAQKEILDLAVTVRKLRSFTQAVQRLREDRRIVKQLTVTSAMSLSSIDRNALRKKMEQVWGMPIILAETVDPAVIGGIRISGEDWEHDATVKGRLKRLKETFAV